MSHGILPLFLCVHACGDGRRFQEGSAQHAPVRVMYRRLGLVLMHRRLDAQASRARLDAQAS
eukprot:356963-Chlamydomonas_euryale.AAC.4